MIKTIATAILTATAVFAAGFSMTTAPPADTSGGRSGKLIVTGSSTIAPLALEIAKRFESLHPGTRIDIQTGGSGRGISDTRAGLCDIGLVSRALKPGENDLHPHTIAHDGIGLIVHRDNPVASLTAAQVTAIYTGHITRWNDLTTRDAPITVVHKAGGRSTLELFLKHHRLNNTAVRPHVVIGDNQQGIKTVAGNPDAIGYVSIGTAEYSVEHGVAIKLLPMSGIAATTANVRAGAFPLSRPLNLITRHPARGLAKRFIEFAQSEQVHDLVTEQYFVPATR